MWFVRQKGESSVAYSSPECLSGAGRHSDELARTQSPSIYSQVLLRLLLLYLRPCRHFHQALPGSALVPSRPNVRIDDDLRSAPSANRYVHAIESVTTCRARTPRSLFGVADMSVVVQGGGMLVSIARSGLVEGAEVVTCMQALTTHVA
jgi:hypothetical protein